MGQLRTYTDAIQSAKRVFERQRISEEEFAREARFALQIVESNPALQKPAMLPSLKKCIENVALIGITLNPAMKLAYLVPRKGQVCLDISYMGLIKIATDSGSVKKVVSRVVYKGDRFEVIQGTEERLVHVPDPFASHTDDDIMGVYCVATLADGTTMHEIMSRKEIDDIKARSKASTGPWVTDYAEMARKTVVKRASKYWPKTKQLMQAIEAANDAEGYIDAAGVESMRQIDEAHDIKLEVTDALRRVSAATGKDMKQIAEEIGIQSIRALGVEECQEALMKLDKMGGQDGRSDNAGNPGGDSAGTDAVDEAIAGDNGQRPD